SDHPGRSDHQLDLRAWPLHVARNDSDGRRLAFLRHRFGRIFGGQVLAPAFYALDKRHLPMLVSLLSIAVNFGLNWFFAFQLKIGHRGLALSTSIVAIMNFLLLYIMMRRYTGRLETGLLVGTFLRLCIAGALLGLVCYG